MNRIKDTALSIIKNRKVQIGALIAIVGAGAAVATKHGAEIVDEVEDAIS